MWNSEVDETGNIGMHIKIQLIPVIRGIGWPSGISLNNPMPKKPPMCYVGTEIVRRIKRHIDFGNILWSLEGYLTEDALKVSNNLSLKQYKKIANDETFSGFWLMNFFPTLKFYVTEIFRLSHLKPLNSAIFLMKHLVEVKNLEQLKDEIIYNIALIICRQHGNANLSLAVWFILCFDYLIAFIKSGDLPHFLNNRINMLSNVDENTLKSLYAELMMKRRNICENPDRVLEIFVQNVEKVNSVVSFIYNLDSSYSPQGYVTPTGSSLWCTSFKDNKSEDTLSMVSSRRTAKEQIEIEDEISVINTKNLNLAVNIKLPENEMSLPNFSEKANEFSTEEDLLEVLQTDFDKGKFTDGTWAKLELGTNSSSSYAESCGIISPLNERKFLDPFENRMLPYHPEDHPSVSTSSSLHTELGSREGERNLTTVQEESDEKVTSCEMNSVDQLITTISNH